jgi:hypothetical protein
LTSGNKSEDNKTADKVQWAQYGNLSQKGNLSEYSEENGRKITAIISI